MGEATQLIISPYFISGPLMGSAIRLRRNIRLSLEELRDVRVIRCLAQGEDEGDSTPQAGPPESPSGP